MAVFGDLSTASGGQAPSTARGQRRGAVLHHLRSFAFGTSTPSRRFVILFVIAYVALTATIAAHHEPWRDEADPWLYVRDADLATIIARTRYAGLPALWFLLLAPLAKLGLPYTSQKVLHIAVAAAAMAIFAARAPLAKLTKILAACSYYFAYEYAVIVRSYALTVLLTFLATALYARRHEHPYRFAVVLFLLFNVNAQGFVIAGAFAALFVLDRVRAPAAVAVMAAGAVLSFLQVRTPPDPARHAARHLFNRDAFAWAVSNAFLPTVPTAIGFIVGLGVLIATTLAVWRARDAVVMLWLPLAGLGIIYTYIWLGGLRHAGFFMLLVLVTVWIAGERMQRAAAAIVLLNVTLLVSDVVAFRYAAQDWRYEFSGAEEVADFIRSQHLTDQPIAAHNLTQGEALLPFLPGVRFWYAGLGEYGTYMKWDTEFERALDVPYPVAEQRARHHFERQPWLLLFNVEMPNPPAHGFRLLYTNRRPIFEKTDERYWLYAPTR